jgi:uroporphyrinogen-III synthase
MTDKPPLRILITGEHDEPAGSFPVALPGDGTRLEWHSLPVLRFEKLHADPDIVERLIRKPVEWIVFSSPRAVRFWSEVLLEHGYDFPTETQVACIGEKTAEVAGEDGFTPDFYPTEPGTEKFLEEFEELVANNPIKPTVFIPMAEGGRLTIRNRLRELGCEVTSMAIYRTLPREDLRQAFSEEELENTALVLFTSPSSVDAFTDVFRIPPQVKIASLGHYTARHLELKGFSDQRMLPAGDFQRIGEVLR